MKIAQRFNQAKQIISNGFKNDSHSLKLLELKLLSAEELKETGFIKRAVDFILVPQEISIQDVNEFFDKICSDLKIDEFESSNFPIQATTAGEFLNGFKFDIVRGFLLKQLYVFIKNEKINLRKKKIMSL